jgi:nitroreductase
MTDDATPPLSQLIRGRISAERFDPQRELSEQQIRELIEDAIQAPSSFNIQHWRFVAVRGADRRRLAEAAFGQRQVAEAPVTFIILGDRKGAEKLPEVMRRAVEQGALPAGKAAAWIRMAGEIYTDERMAHDEALRSATLAAMVLMLSAAARGLGSGALSGFDVDKVREEFDIDGRYVPAMLLCVGYPLGDAPPRQPRLSVDEVLAFDRGKIF